MERVACCYYCLCNIVVLWFPPLPYKKEHWSEENIRFAGNPVYSNMLPSISTLLYNWYNATYHDVIIEERAMQVDVYNNASRSSKSCSCTHFRSMQLNVMLHNVLCSSTPCSTRLCSVTSHCATTHSRMPYSGTYFYQRVSYLMRRYAVLRHTFVVRYA